MKNKQKQSCGFDKNGQESSLFACFLVNLEEVMEMGVLKSQVPRAENGRSRNECLDC